MRSHDWQRLELARKVCASCHCGTDTRPYDLPIFNGTVRLCEGCRDAVEVFL